MANTRYYEVAFSFTNRANIISVDELPELIQKAQQHGKELYRSYFSFDESVKEHVQRTKSVSGFQGPFHVESIILDVDKKEDTDEGVRKRAVGAYLELVDDWLPSEQIKIYYSGTGYHFEIPNIFRFSASHPLSSVKATLNKYFPWADDLYYNTSLIRVAGTINKKTNRYKIRLTSQELTSFDVDVPALASNIERAKHDTSVEYLEEDIPNFFEKIVSSHGPSVGIKISAEQFRRNESRKVISCVQRMYDNGPTVGSRHNTALRIASAYRRAGVPASGVANLLISWGTNKRGGVAGLSEEESNTITNQVFGKGYRYGCHDEIMSKHCSSDCWFYAKKNYDSPVSSVSDMKQNYLEYLRKMKHGVTLNLRDVYPFPHDFFLRPGEFITVLGDTGIGKTAWVQNIILGMPKTKVLYLSLEVNEALLFRRFVQIANRLNEAEVNSIFENMSEAMQDSMIEKIKHIQVVTIPPTIQAVEKMIIEHQPHITIIDTLDGLDVDAKGETEMTQIIAKNMTRIANSTNTVILGIHHISKHAAIDEKGERRTLHMHSGKGSSSVEQKSDTVISIEATGGNETTTRYVTSLKARDNKPFIRIPFTFEFETFCFNHMRPDLRIVGQEEAR